LVRYRSIFDVVRDFLHDEAMDGHERIMASYLKPDVLIIDDFGMKQLPKRSGEFLFEIVMRRYETRSTMMTTNRPIEDWGKLLGDVPTATAILDRFLHHSEIITITGQSYRLRNRAEGSKPTGHRPQVGRPTGSKKNGKQSKPAKAPTGSRAEQVRI
jgi:DNA replication protein DnaC